MGENWKVFVSHVNVHQRVRIYIISWIRWFVLWISDSLFPQSPVSLPSRHMKNVAIVTQMEVIHRLLFAKVDLATATAKCPSVSSRDQCWAPGTAQFPRSASYLVTDWLHWTASIMEEAVFCSYWNRQLLWIQICLPSMQYFCPNYHLWT